MSDDQNQGKTGEDLAAEALNQADDSNLNEEDELAQSNQLADTLMSLQNLVEKHALELTRIAGELKEKRQSLKNVFENDVQLAEAKAEVDLHTEQVKARKSQLQNDPQATSLKIDIAELNQQKKEIEETLSNHLVNYHSLTKSTSFDTSDGDQWEFKIQAKIKAKKS